MKNISTFTIPDELNERAFFKEGTTVSVNPSEYTEWNVQGIFEFKYEILAFNGMASYLPWEHASEVLPDVLGEWGKINQELDILYAERNAKLAAPLMEKAIHICFSYLYWLNLKPVVLKDWGNQAEALEFVPVNFSERMAFALSRPGLYQSYKVIGQIMVELQKLAAKAQIRRMRKG